MTTVEAIKIFINAVEDSAIPYMIVGSFSSNLYGYVRSTQDLDLVVFLSENSLAILAARLGDAYSIDPQTSFETATFSIRNIVEIKESGFKIELFHLKDDDHDQERFRRRVRREFNGLSANFATAEDVIVMKLRWVLRIDRERDRNDVKHVIAMQKDHLDWPYIETWCDKHGTRQLLEEIRQSVAGI